MSTIFRKIKTSHVLFWLYLLALPLMMIPRPGLLGAKIQYADIIFIFLFILWFVSFLRHKKAALPSNEIIISAVLLISSNLFSCLGSKTFSGSILDYLGLVYLVSILFVFSSGSRDKIIFSTGVQIIFLTSLIASIIGAGSFIFYSIAKYHWARSFLLFSPLKASIVPFPRIRSTFLSPEMFIVFSQLGMVCGMISLELHTNPRIKRIFLIGILIIITAAILSYSRSLAGFFMALSIIVFYKKNIRFPVLIRTLTILVFSVLLISAIIFSIWVIYPVTLSKDKTAGLTTLTFQNSPDIRAFLRDAAFRIALKHPFRGIGQGMFTYELKNYIDMNAVKNTIKINKFGSLEIDPHCAYCSSIAETGFLGLVFMLIFFYFIIIESVKSIKRSYSPKWRNIKIFLLASFFGYLLTAWFVDIFSIRQFWINMALLIACNNMVEI